MARDGLVVGEGAATLVLEDYDHALARGARIHAEVVGFGCNSDGVHMTQPTASTMARAMQLALDDARLAPDEIGYVNAHGTSTDRGDVAESHATAQTFGERMPISSLKSYVGHTLGACGALEAWWTIEMMKRNWYAPTLNLQNVDPGCAVLDYIVGEGRTLDTDHVMTNNFAFGGINTSLIFQAHAMSADRRPSLQAASRGAADSRRAAREIRRVVVTGMGIVSCLGNSLDGVSAALRSGRPGLTRIDAWRARGFASQVAGVASVADEPAFDRKLERFMGDTARFACHAARKAIDDAGLDPAALRSPQAGAVIGSGVGTMSAYDASMAIAHTRGIERVPPYTVPQAMSSTTSANVAQVFGLEGGDLFAVVGVYDLDACHRPGVPADPDGRQQIVLAGGAEALHDNMTLLFDAMGVLSRGFNDAPEHASRPYDVARDGFVMAEGGGVLVLESLDHALARGARIHAELTGYGVCTDGAGMVTPHASSIARAMRSALDEAGVHPGYINTHAPSTPLGDIGELEALGRGVRRGNAAVFIDERVTGHAPGACGVHEAIYTLLMMRDGFIAGSAGIDVLDDRAANLPLVRVSRAAHIEAAMSVSFGFAVAARA